MAGKEEINFFYGSTLENNGQNERQVFISFYKIITKTLQDQTIDYCSGRVVSRRRETRHIDDHGDGHVSINNNIYLDGDEDHGDEDHDGWLELLKGYGLLLWLGV